MTTYESTENGGKANIYRNINDKSVITAMLAVNRKVFDNLFVVKSLNMS